MRRTYVSGRHIAVERVGNDCFISCLSKYVSTVCCRSVLPTYQPCISKGTLSSSMTDGWRKGGDFLCVRVTGWGSLPANRRTRCEICPSDHGFLVMELLMLLSCISLIKLDLTAAPPPPPPAQPAPVMRVRHDAETVVARSPKRKRVRTFSLIPVHNSEGLSLITKKSVVSILNQTQEGPNPRASKAPRSEVASSPARGEREKRPRVTQVKPRNSCNVILSLPTLAQVVAHSQLNIPLGAST